MTQLEMARKGVVSPQMEAVARDESLEASFIQAGLCAGNIVVPANINHAGLTPCGVGKGLRTKVNANLGTSSDVPAVDNEMKKLKIAIEAGADAVMDLSTGGDIRAIRRAVLRQCHLALGTVPIYQAALEAIDRHGAMVDMTTDELFAVIEEQARDGVDFMTVHCGVTLPAIETLKHHRRVTDVVSRGGAFLVGWMLHNEKENPLYSNYDRLLELARKYDFTLSLGDGMRPGSLADATDRVQIEELVTLGKLVDRAWEAGVQVMVEGPGHIPLDQVAMNVQMEKSLCRGAPFYVLGPLVTDIGAGYDHITSAIGGAIAAAAGADFLCYVTPAEHLALPQAEDVKNGVIASRIAAHAADIVKGVKGAREWDRDMSVARKKLDWENQVRLSLDPEHVRQVHEKYAVKGKACSMCGDFCAMDLVEKYLGVSTSRC